MGRKVIPIAKYIESKNLAPGDTLELPEGTYTGNYTWTQQNVTIIGRGRTIFTGSHELNGIGCAYKNIEFAGNGSAQLVGVNGAGTRLERCIVHDGSGGMAGGSGADCEIVDSIIYYCGSSVNGHNVYCQNVTGTKTFRNCIVFDSFGFGFHAYSQSPKLNGLQFVDCIMFQAGNLNPSGTYYTDNLFIGGSYESNDCVVDNCLSYYDINPGSKLQGNVRFGYGGNGSRNLDITNSIFLPGRAGVGLNEGIALSFWYLKPRTMTGNKIYSRLEYNSQGFDHASEYPNNEYLPFGTPDLVKLNRCTSVSGRAHVAIVNGSLANTVRVDVSSVFSDGAQIQVRNVQNYFSDIQTLAVSGGGIDVNMQAGSRTVGTPVVWPSPAKTFPRFGCFVLEASGV